MPDTLLRLPSLTLRICEPVTEDQPGRRPRRWLLRWELFDDDGEIVAVHPWYIHERSAKVAKLATLRHALNAIGSVRLTCPHITILFPFTDPPTHDKAFTMLRRRPRPHWQRSFDTYMAV